MIECQLCGTPHDEAARCCVGPPGRLRRLRTRHRPVAEPLGPRRPAATAVGALLVAGLAFGALTLAAGGQIAPVRSALLPYGGGAGGVAASPGTGASATAGGSPGGLVAVAVVPLAGAVRGTPGAAPSPTGCGGEAAVPDVSRLAYPASSRALLAAGFPGVDVAEHSGSVPLGGTVSMSPAAGSVRPCGTEVTLVYSSGPAPATVPVAGPGLRALSPLRCTLPPADGGASALLGRLRGLLADDRRTRCALSVTWAGAYSSSVPAGDVISEQPLPGTRVGLGTAVLLTVSSGAPSCALPTVTGDRQAAAIAALAQLRADDGGRCDLAVAVTGVPSGTAAGAVLAQDPAAGTAVAPGGAVTLTVSDGPPASAGPSASASPPSSAPPSASAGPSGTGTPTGTPTAGPAGSGGPSG